MLFYIALIVATYAVARLIQVPLEAASMVTKEGARAKFILLSVVSLIATGVIGFGLWEVYLHGAAAAAEMDRRPRF